MSDPFDDDVADSVEEDNSKANLSETKPEEVAKEVKGNDDHVEKHSVNSIAPKAERTHASDLDKNTLLHEIYKDTKIDFSIDDPIIVALLANHKFLIDSRNDLEKVISGQSKQLNDSINATLTNGLKIFDERFSAMQGVLNDLDKQKEHLIAEVYAKSKINIQESIAKQFKKEITDLVKTSSTNNNQIKNQLIGGVIGAFLGVVLAMLFIFILK